MLNRQIVRTTVIAAFALTIAIGSVVQAGLVAIQPTGVRLVSGEGAWPPYGESPENPAVNLINQSGLSPNYSTGVTPIGELPPNVAEAAFTTGWKHNVTLDFDLGEVYPVSCFALWNLSAYYRAQIYNFTLTASPYEDYSSSVYLGQFQALGRGHQRSDGRPELFYFTETDARYIRLVYTNEYNGFYSGAQEVAFGVVPEPASAAVLATGLIAFLSRRHPFIF